MPYLFVMFYGKMIFFFGWATKRNLHSIAIGYVSQSMNTKSGSSFSTLFHAKIALIKVEMTDLFPE